jgi:hypothetical protein
MRAAIFSFVRVSETSMVASVRIARFLSKRMDVPIVSDEKHRRDRVWGCWGHDKDALQEGSHEPDDAIPKTGRPFLGHVSFAGGLI